MEQNTSMHLKKSLILQVFNVFVLSSGLLETLKQLEASNLKPKWTKVKINLMAFQCQLIDFECFHFSSVWQNWRTCSSIDCKTSRWNVDRPLHSFLNYQSRGQLNSLITVKKFDFPRDFGILISKDAQDIVECFDDYITDLTWDDQTLFTRTYMVIFLNSCSS